MNQSIFVRNAGFLPPFLGETQSPVAFVMREAGGSFVDSIELSGR